MSLNELVLRKISEWSPQGEERQTLAFVDPATGTAVHLAVDHVETLGLKLWDLSVTRSASAAAKEKSLDEWAKRVADRVTGLMEPLHVLEIDRQLGQAMLRSEEPAQKSEDLFYYEVLLHKAGSATLKRYRGSRETAGREQVAFTVTREAAAKLVVDLAG